MAPRDFASFGPSSWRRVEEEMPEWSDTFVQQKEWGVGRGGLLANSTYILLALFFGGVGGGAALLSLIIERQEASWYFFVGYLIAVVGKGTFHLLFLGHPERFWRAVSRPDSSWISRGIITLSVLSVVGGLYLLGPITGWLPVADSNVGEEILFYSTVVLLSILIAYDGFLLKECVAIPAWNTSLMVLIIPTFNLLGATGVLGALYGAIHTEVAFDIDLLHEIETVLLGAGAFLLIGYMVALQADPFARPSLREAMLGRLKWLFWPVAVIGGVVAPLIVASLSLTTHVPIGVFTAIALIAVVGDYAFKYTVLSIGAFRPQYAPPQNLTVQPSTITKRAARRWYRGVYKT